jgi:hypothetical protein
VINFKAIQVGEALVPVVWVPLQDPDLFVLARDVSEWAGAGVVEDIAEIVVVLLQSLFRTMIFQPLAKAPSMNLLGRGSLSRKTMVLGSTTLMSLTAENSGVWGMLMPFGGQMMRE